MRAILFAMMLSACCEEPVEEAASPSGVSFVVTGTIRCEGEIVKTTRTEVCLPFGADEKDALEIYGDIACLPMLGMIGCLSATCESDAEAKNEWNGLPEGCDAFAR